MDLHYQFPIAVVLLNNRVRAVARMGIEKQLQPPILGVAPYRVFHSSVVGQRLAIGQLQLNKCIKSKYLSKNYFKIFQDFYKFAKYKLNL